MYSSTIDINLQGLERFGREVSAELLGKQGPISDCLELWAARYRSFAQLRFDQYSRGGGNWKRLADSTIKARRQGKRRTVMKYGILRDTGTLFAALSPTFNGAPGALNERIQYGIRTGYGGTQRYTDDRGKGTKATIADIASFHQNGNLPRLPKREIIVNPPSIVIQAMARDMSTALKDVSTTFNG